jgi:hypothetical protein
MIIHGAQSSAESAPAAIACAEGNTMTLVEMPVTSGNEK